MAASDEVYQLAIAEFQRSGSSGLYRRMVQVAYLRSREEGGPAWAWLEDTIARFKRSVEATYSSFAASASYARAIAHFGVIGDQTLRQCLDDLAVERLDFSEQVLEVVSKVHRQTASRARRASGARAEGTRWGDTYPVLRSVETLIDFARKGDRRAVTEIEMIRVALASPR